MFFWCHWSKTVADNKDCVQAVNVNAAGCAFLCSFVRFRAFIRSREDLRWDVYWEVWHQLGGSLEGSRYSRPLRRINEGLENIWELEEVDRLETLNVPILPEELERTTKQCLVNCTLCLSWWGLFLFSLYGLIRNYNRRVWINGHFTT